MTVDNTEKMLCGLLSYKPRWGFTWLGWLILILIIPLTGIFLAWRAYPFLAISKPVSSDVMVVEGWIAKPLLKIAGEKFQEGHYKFLYVIGGSSGNNIGEEKTSIAEIAVNHLIQFGISPDCVTAVSAESDVRRDRTYESAVALRKWFDSNDIVVSSLNIVTEGPHSRRSRRIFKMAFHNDVSIGVIPIPACDYDPSIWWDYSEGAKEVLSEMAAYLYVRFLFDPE